MEKSKEKERKGKIIRQKIVYNNMKMIDSIDVNNMNNSKQNQFKMAN